MFWYYWDPTYILVLIGLGICLLASSNVKNTYHKYARVKTLSGITGAEAAHRVLYSAGITDVQIERVQGELTDHYDPKNKVLRLSDSVYDSPSLAAVGVAAHECGHAIQHAEGYAPLDIRTSIVPVANIGSAVSWPLFILGLIMSVPPLVTAGIVMFSMVVLFQLVTLPVEFNASSRAIERIQSTGILYTDEVAGAKKVLNAAALTYVAGLASSILQLLRLIVLSGGRRRD